MKSIYTILLLSLLPFVLNARTVCNQFKDHAEAQRYFEAKRHGYKSLDRDHDGEACECLRGGSGYNKSVCRRWRKKHGR